MGNLSLTLACGAYDHMEALSRGLVQPVGVDLTFLGIQSPPEIFARMIKTDAFDISEMSLSMYFTLRTKGSFPYVAIPVFPARAFRHAYIFGNRELAFIRPKIWKASASGCSNTARPLRRGSAESFSTNMVWIFPAALGSREGSMARDHRTKTWICAPLTRSISLVRRQESR